MLELWLSICLLSWFWLQLGFGTALDPLDYRQDPWACHWYGIFTTSDQMKTSCNCFFFQFWRPLSEMERSFYSRHHSVFCQQNSFQICEFSQIGEPKFLLDYLLKKSKTNFKIYTPMLDLNIKPNQDCHSYSKQQFRTRKKYKFRIFLSFSKKVSKNFWSFP